MILWLAPRSGNTFLRALLKTGFGIETRSIYNESKVRRMEQWQDLFVKGKCEFGPWSRHVEQWTSRSGPTSVIRFEELIREPIEQTLRAFEKLGLPLDEPAGGSVPTFEELHARFPEFFRSGKVGTWQTEMPPAVQDLFWQNHGGVMERMGDRREPVVF